MGTTRHRCKVCLQYDHIVGPVSRRGYCRKCGQERKDANTLSMKLRQGPDYEHMMYKWAQSNGGSGRPITPFDMPDNAS